MSDDYFFGEEDFDDSAFIAGLDAFEATHNLQPRQQVTKPGPSPVPVAARPVFRPPSRPAPVPVASTSRPKPPPTEVIDISDDEFKFDDSFDLENADWEGFDQRAEAQVQQPEKRTGPIPGPSTTTAAARQFTRTSSGKLQQQTLWGLPAPPENRSKLPPRQKGKSIKKTKTWDRTEYSKTGWMAAKKKNKPHSSDGEGEEEEEEQVDFVQFPRPDNYGEVHLRLILIIGGLNRLLVVVGYGIHPHNRSNGVLTCA